MQYDLPRQLHLIENRDRIVSKEELLNTIWSDRFVSEATLSSRVMSARKAVGDSGRMQQVIQTVHGRGFRFIAPVEARDESPGYGRDVVERPKHISAVDAAKIGATSVSSGSRGGADAESVQQFAFIGRVDELRKMRTALDRAREAKRQVVFVTGEAGVGKSALIEAFLREAAGAHPMWVLRGHCLDYRDLSEPYMPVLEALGRICRGRDAEGVMSIFQRYAPTWLVQMPWLLSAAEEQRLLQLTAGSTRERMLREMIEAVEMLSGIRPVLLLLEDLHWSDLSTLDLVSALAHRADQARLIVVGTYRPSEVQSDHLPVDDLQYELRIRGQCVRLALSPLNVEEIEDYLRDSFPGLRFCHAGSGRGKDASRGAELRPRCDPDVWNCRERFDDRSCTDKKLNCEAWIAIAGTNNSP